MEIKLTNNSDYKIFEQICKFLEITFKITCEYAILPGTNGATECKLGWQI